MQVRIQRVGASDGARLREIRLRMLADTPLAYGETLEDARGLSDEDWRARADALERPGSIALVAVDDDGRWVGMMRGEVVAPHGPMLVGVFVDPSARGRDAGVADALLDGIIAWAGGEGRTLALEVHVDNERAIRFYERRGFAPTGRMLPYELPPFGQELEMRMDLGTGPSAERVTRRA
ncbi:MAG: GNAT family N-acetyltransferase [Microbacterium sp.]